MEMYFSGFSIYMHPDIYLLFHNVYLNWGQIIMFIQPLYLQLVHPTVLHVLVQLYAQLVQLVTGWKTKHVVVCTIV